MSAQGESDAMSGEMQRRGGSLSTGEGGEFQGIS